MAPQGVVVIGLDSADYGLISRWAEDGQLPVMKALLDRSRWGEVRNPLGLEAGSVWPSFSTGSAPGEHGQFEGWTGFDTQAYRRRQVGRETVNAPIWRRLSDAGKRVVVIDYPYAFLEGALNGIQVADWYTHVRTEPTWLATIPPDAAGVIARDYGTNPFVHDDPCPTNYADLSSGEAVEAFTQGLLSRIAHKEAYAARLLENDPADFHITVFHEPHDVGHMCWHLHDPEHELFDPVIAQRVGDPILRVYQALDATVGRLLEAAGEDRFVMVYCSHGMGRETTASNFLSDILTTLERAYIGPPPETRLDRIRRVYRALVPPALRQMINRTPAAKRAYHDNEMSRDRYSPFFELTPNQATGGVRFNIKGREANGILAVGQEYESLRDRLIADLRAIVNLDTGLPLIDDVLVTDEIHPGPRCHALPDLLLEWNKSGPIRRVESPVFGVLENKRPRPRTGDHINKAGVYLAQARGLAPGRVDHVVDVTDLAPTLARLVGVPEIFPDRTPIAELVEPPV